jgi:two-component system phosphate regulon response regulator PhoB
MTAENPRVLIAESADPIARAFLAENLAADHYQPVCATDSAAALELLAGPLDALLVDVNGDTLAIVDLVRAETLSGIDPQLPILVLTSRTDGLHRTRLLERGADDVLAKPFSYPELPPRPARGAAAPRTRPPRTARAARRLVTGRCPLPPCLGRRGRDRGLRGKEYQLLLALVAEPERVFTRQELLGSVWGLGSYARTRTLDSTAVRLRARLQIGEQRFVRNV